LTPAERPYSNAEWAPGGRGRLVHFGHGYMRKFWYWVKINSADMRFYY